VFTGCSSGVVCFISYRQCVQSEILEHRIIEFVNKVILFNLIVYYREENCVLLGYYAVSNVNLIPKFRNSHSQLKGSFDT
jgi:hypothetical protein